MGSSIQHRYDFALLFDVTDGNPNGDPEAGNLPRFDPETGIGLVTDVCLKRKIRNFVSLAMFDQAPYEIYIKERAILSEMHRQAWEHLGLLDQLKDLPDAEKIERAQRWMCERFYDVRAFGAVMSTGQHRCGQVKGPVQLTFARSMDQVVPAEHILTRIAVNSDKDVARQGGEFRAMGRKYTIPYGLYRSHGFVSAPLARKVGFSEADLELLWQSLVHMFEHDRSASRGQMTTRGLFVFQHDSPLGSAPAHHLLERIRVTKRDPTVVPRKFDDYVVDVNEQDLPKGVRLMSMI